MTHLLLAAAVLTMRVDYYHTGNATQEHFSLDRVVVEPLPWPGNPARPIDALDRGKYFFEVVDAASGKVVYSRGFASMYGEWETTAEAKSMNRTFSESLRFPGVDKPVRIVLKKRDPKNAFREIWTTTVDPADKFIVRSGPQASAGAADEAARARRSRGEARPADSRGRLHGRRARQVRTRRPAADGRAVRDVAVQGARARHQRLGARARRRWIRASRGRRTTCRSGTPLGTTYDTFDSERYILTTENRAFRDIAANAPYDVVEILVNTEKYGGGGIYGLYSTVAADNLWAPYIFVHEFGHHLAGLADEYFTSDVAYLPAADRVEPWEPNVTALLDAAKLKWKDLVQAGTPLPTPWAKEQFEKDQEEGQKRRREIRANRRPESEMNALFREELARTTAQLGSGPFAGKVGAFEGANYEAKGYYRPQADCIMFTRDQVPFCAVCRRALEQTLDSYTGR